MQVEMAHVILKQYTKLKGRKDGENKQTFLIGNQRCDLCNLAEKKNIKPDFIVEDLYSAAKIIAKLEPSKEE